MEPLKICAILPAAGFGTRVDLETEKQFYPVLDRPVLSYTISAFEALDEVEAIVVVVREERREEFLAIVKRFGHRKVYVAIGSTSRHRSIAEGLKVAKSSLSDRPDIVVVHDGARPLAEGEDILAVARAASQHGAAGMTRPLTSTVLEVGDGFMKQSLDRDAHRASETPQAFQYQILCQAYEQCTEHELNHGTECLQLVQKYSGTKVKLLEGSDRLCKITYKRDLSWFEEALRNCQWKRPVTVFHEPVDYNVIEKFWAGFASLAKDVSLVSYHGTNSGRFPSDSGTFLFLKQAFQISLETVKEFPDCTKDCHKRLCSVDFDGSFIKNHVFEIFGAVHGLISGARLGAGVGTPHGFRACLVFLYADRSTVPLVQATRMMESLLRQNHGDECDVALNSAMFLNKELTTKDVSQFLKDLHSMNPGMCNFY